MRAFTEKDGDLNELAGRRVAVIGYGNQGRAQALNLRDSGVAGIVVGTLRDDSWARAEADGFPVRDLAEAAAGADVLLLLLPDEELADAFESEVRPRLRPGPAIVLASGYALAFGDLAPPADADVLLLAPRMIGEKVRSRFERGDGFYSYVAVEQEASGRAWPLLLALAKGIGTLRRGAFELSARQEAVLDLFHEQGFGSLIGGLVLTMLEVGRSAGLPEEALVLDLYLSGEAAETFAAMAEQGFYEQSRLHSLTSQYGGMLRALELDRAPLRRHLERVLTEVQSGEFARRWRAERESGYKTFLGARELARFANPFSPIEARIRKALLDSAGDA
jgi:ketol-acid reductoisomerase